MIRRVRLQRSHMTAKGPAARRTAAKRRAREREKARVYRLVDLRDLGECRACRALCLRGGVADRLEHHHIRPRSLGGKHTTGNVVTLCRSCHVAVHAKRVTVTGDANDVLMFRDASWVAVFSGPRSDVA